MLASAKLIASGIATVSIAGAGVGIFQSKEILKRFLILLFYMQK